MDISIGNYRITSDDRNIILQHLEVTQKGDNAGKERWETDGYYKNLEYCCERLLDKKINRSDAQSVKELISEINQAKEEIKEAMPL